MIVNIVDTSGWLEYFMNGKNADFFEPILLDTDNLIVSTINIYEVAKVIGHRVGEDAFSRAMSSMLQAEVIDLTTEIAILASEIALEEKIPMADAMILATARANRALLWTQDADFEGIEGVKYIRKIAY